MMFLFRFLSTGNTTTGRDTTGESQRDLSGVRTGGNALILHPLGRRKVRNRTSAMKAGWRENIILPTTFTPLSVAIIVLTSVVIPAACLWMAQPLYAARVQRANQFASEDIFWHVGAEGLLVKGEPFPLPTGPPSTTLSVVVPAHNEQDRLPSMLQTTLAYLEDRRQNDSSFSFEVIVVSDGSTDNTANEVKRWSYELGTDVVRLLELQGNQGKGAAVRKGMLRMRGEYGLMADADAATDISDVDRLLVRMKDIERTGTSPKGPVTHGMVVGSRAHMEGEAVAKRAWHRTLLMYVFHWCVSLLCTRQIRDTQCGFKLFTRDTAMSVFGSLHLHRWAFDTELVYICQLLGIPMSEVPVNWREVEGSKLIRSKLDIVTTSATMLRDMLCLKVFYVLGVWKVSPTATGLLSGAGFDKKSDPAKIDDGNVDSNKDR